MTHESELSAPRPIVIPEELAALRSENSRLAALIAEAIRWRAGNWSQTAGALNKLAASTREEGS